MNHKELISGVSQKLNLSKAEVENLVSAMVKVISSELNDGKTIGFPNFGNFEVRKKEERLSVHPATQIRTLIPPKLVVNFKQSSSLKERINENQK